MSGFDWLFLGIWLVLVAGGIALALWHDDKQP